MRIKWTETIQSEERSLNSQPPMHREQPEKATHMQAWDFVFFFKNADSTMEPRHKKGRGKNLGESFWGSETGPLSRKWHQVTSSVSELLWISDSYVALIPPPPFWMRVFTAVTLSLLNTVYWLGVAGRAETHLLSSEAFRLKETIFKELTFGEPHPPVDMIYTTESWHQCLHGKRFGR